VGETSFIINENLSLNDNIHVVDETIQEISEPICDEDFLPINKLIDTISFHKEDRVVTFNELEGCLLFKDDLNHEVEDPYMDLLQSTRRLTFLIFTKYELTSSGHSKWPSFCFFGLLNESVSRIRVNSQLLDWIYWIFCII